MSTHPDLRAVRRHSLKNTKSDVAPSERVFCGNAAILWPICCPSTRVKRPTPSPLPTSTTSRASSSLWHRKKYAKPNQPYIIGDSAFHKVSSTHGLPRVRSLQRARSTGVAAAAVATAAAKAASNFLEHALIDREAASFGLAPTTIVFDLTIISRRTCT